MEILKTRLLDSKSSPAADPGKFECQKTLKWFVRVCCISPQRSARKKSTALEMSNSSVCSRILQLDLNFYPYESKVFVFNTQNIAELKQCIRNDIAAIPQCMLGNVTESMQNRWEVCMNMARSRPKNASKLFAQKIADLCSR